MEPDLEQVRLAAKKIVNSMSKLKNNPIYNYILVVFRDPGKNCQLKVLKQFLKMIIFLSKRACIFNTRS